MDDANRRALLAEVQRQQRLCASLRIAIMLAARHGEFPRWRGKRLEDGTMAWTHERLKLRDSIQAPFPHEIEDNPGAFERRMAAAQTIRYLHDMERVSFDQASDSALLQAASSVFATIFPALRVILRHAQEYGVCWAWLKSTDVQGTETFTASTIAEALCRPSIGHPSASTLALRQEAAAWIERNGIVYKGDQTDPR